MPPAPPTLPLSGPASGGASNAAPQPAAQRVLRCRVAGGVLVVPADLVAATSQADIAPPPPGAPAWCGGLAWLDGALVTVIDFAPAGPLTPRRRVHLVRLAGTPAAALVVEALGQWALATVGAALPAALRPAGWVCGPGWLRSGISGGERLALLDVTAVQAALLLAPEPPAPVVAKAAPGAVQAKKSAAPVAPVVAGAVKS